MGVPVIGCQCDTCRSDDPRDKRLRSSALVEVEGKNILIDCGPDFREQILRAGSPAIDAILLTHSHYDHVGGLDDLRPYTYRNPDLPIYCRADVASDIRSRLPYCFAENPYPGIPTLNLVEVSEASQSVEILPGIEVNPIPVWHGRLPILGWRIGDFAYITDASAIPDTSLERLRGLDTLILNALRDKPQPTHFSIAEAISVAQSLAPRQTFFTHLAMEAGRHADLAARLPGGIAPAYDGLTLCL